MINCNIHTFHQFLINSGIYIFSIQKVITTFVNSYFIFQNNFDRWEFHPLLLGGSIDYSGKSWLQVICLVVDGHREGSIETIISCVYIYIYPRQFFVTLGG